MKKITNFTSKAFKQKNLAEKKLFVGGYFEKADHYEETIDVYIDPKTYTIDEIFECGFMSTFFEWVEEKHGIDKDAFEKLPFYKKAEMIYNHEENDELARIEVFASEEEAKEYLEYCKFLREGI